MHTQRQLGNEHSWPFTRPVMRDITMRQIEYIEYCQKIITLQFQYKRTKQIICSNHTFDIQQIKQFLKMFFRERNQACKVHDFKYVIIDTDGGGDDIQALFLLDHFAKKYGKKILGIVASDGNASVENVVKNTLIAQALMGSNYPIYIGSECSMIGSNLKDYFFGLDGIGEQQQNYLKQVQINEGLVQKEKGFKFIVDSAIKHKGQIAFINIGPLTTLALAYHYNNQIASCFTNVSIMGGADGLLGNFHSYTSEFNIALDPEASSCVLRKFNNILLSTFDTTIFGMESDVFQYLFKLQNTKKAKFIRDAFLYQYEKTPPIIPLVCDPVAVIALFRPDLIKSGINLKVDVHLKGKATRGSTTVDYFSPENQKHNCYIVKALDLEKVRKQVQESYH